MAGPARDDTRSERSDTATLLWGAAGLVLLLWLLRQMVNALLVFFLALVFAIALSRPIGWLERRGWKRGLATAAVMLVVALVVVGLAWLVGPRVAEQLTDLMNDLPDYIQSISDRLSSLLANYPDLQKVVQTRSADLSSSLPSAMSVVSQAWHFSLLALEFVAMLIILTSLIVYLAANPRPLLAGYVRALPPRLREPGVRAWQRASGMVAGWVKANFIVGLIEAVAAGVFLSFLQVPGALVWAAFTFFAEFVPRIGGYLMATPPVIVALSVGPGTALWVAVAYTIMNEIMGNLVVPRVRGSTMHLHPALLIFVALAMALAFGLIGALVATPLTGFLEAYFHEFFLARRPELEHPERTVEAMLAPEAAE
jgi:putative permease